MLKKGTAMDKLLVYAMNLKWNSMLHSYEELLADTLLDETKTVEDKRSWLICAYARVMDGIRRKHLREALELILAEDNNGTTV